MTETIQPEVPGQHGYQILARLQIGSYFHLVIITAVGSRAAFQSALEDDKFSIEPNPIFAVGRYQCFHAFGHSVERDVPAESKPSIHRVGVSF